MSEIAIVHLDLASKGGGEAVAMNVMDTLQDDHDLTLISLTRPDVASLNAYFNTDVDPKILSVRLAGRFAPKLHRRFGVKYYVLQNAILGRYARRHAGEFDLLVSTINELGLPPGSIEYVHFPFDWTVSLDNRGDIFHPKIENGSLYEYLCRRIAGVEKDDIRSNTVFANSEWTASCFANAYGHLPEVLHPPIDTEEFDPEPWGDREVGFVTIGRIERSKRIAEMIRIIDNVRRRGHDVHLHVIGPTYDHTYYADIVSMATARSYVSLEGELSRSDLVQMICAHRFGIHGKQHEHFGMAVAEIAAGGAIPFMPANGGQRTIVNGDNRLLYQSIEDAADKIDLLLANPALQRELRLDAREIDQRFGRDRFNARIRSAVAEALDQPVGKAIPSGQPLDEGGESTTGPAM